METCDIDVQDQIVGCLYEIVEAHRTEIRSGWRPLFGTLRNARNRPLHISNVTDIFRVFLDSDNTLVFANAGLDCILCLLSYLEISGGSIDDENNLRPTEFLFDTLKFLERCASILAFMHSMPKCPNLHSTYKIKGITYTHVIDANIPNSMENFTYFGNEHLQNNNEKHMISYRSLHIEKESITKLDELDKSSGVLKVWFLLLDGLTNSLIVCPIAHQAPLLQTIFKLFRSLINSPGIDFGFYCINHLLIPMIQDWLRYINKTQKNWNLIEKNFKHCCGMTTDLVVEFIEKSQKIDKKLNIKVTAIHRPGDNLKFAQQRNSNNNKSFSSSSDENSSSSSPKQMLTAGATLSLKQLFLVLIECTAQSQESIARVGVSCLKHVILTTGHIFNDEQWMVACSAIHRACTVTIAPLRQLAFAFNEKSNSFYGDCCTVKVTAKADSTIDELVRIHALAQQVFLMDSQRDPPLKNGHVTHEVKPPLDDRSYSFLLYPLPNGYNVDNFVIRIPYRNLVVGLLANQMLLQLVANLLMGRLKCVPSSVHSCIFDNYPTSKPEIELDFKAKEILFRCVKQYLTSALEFDSRPGLKFLIQKVSNIDYAANLYKQMTSSWMIYYLTLVDSYLNDITSYNLSMDDLKYILESCSNSYTTTSKKNENFVRYLFALQDTMNLICEMYLEQCNIQDLENEVFIESKLTVKPLDENDENKIINLEEKNRTDNQNNSQQDDHISMASIIVSQNQRTNPFDTNRCQSNENSDSQQISPEIEQQRSSSILKDTNFKKASLTQLVVASMELLRSLPDESAENFKLILTPAVKEAFRLVKNHGNEIKV